MTASTAVTSPPPSGVGVNAAPAVPFSRLGTLGLVLIGIGSLLAALTLLAFLLPRLARMRAGATARRRERRQAGAARAKVADDTDDPFWQPPLGDVHRPTVAEPTEAVDRLDSSAH